MEEYDDVKPDFENISDTEERKAAYSRDLKNIICSISGYEKDEIDDESDFEQMGLESIMLVNLRNIIQDRYHCDISVNRFYEDLINIDLLADFLSYENN